MLSLYFAVDGKLGWGDFVAPEPGNVGKQDFVYINMKILYLMVKGEG